MLAHRTRLAMSQLPPQSIRTTRLLLRLPHLSDAAVMFARWAQDPEVCRYLVWRPHTSIEETKAFLARCVRCWQAPVSAHGSAMGTPGSWAFPWMIENAGGDLIGMIEMRLAEHMADIGYNIMRAEWGKGLAPEAGVVTNWALGQPDIYRVWATCDVDNIRSTRVLEKIGMLREGTLKRWIVHPNVSSEPRDSFVYSRTR